VGRSLGVHLILATQKPSGTVDEEIWGNSRFRICLRVQDRQDSMEVLHRQDAAFVTNVGRGFFQVGNDELFEEFQSGWSQAPYDPSHREKKAMPFG
jgi:S-DNA-T family DNA segregation ATPase FtsK/SpoIIIE